VIGLFRLHDQLERRRQRLGAIEIVVPQPLDREVGRLEVPVRHEQHVDLEACLDGRDVRALLVQEEGRDVDGHLRDDLRVFSFIAPPARCAGYGAPWTRAGCGRCRGNRAGM